MLKKQTIYYSLVCATLLQGADVALEPMKVQSDAVTATTIQNISGEELKSADLAEALMKSTPNVSLVRRSGIANDIILRGQKKDNINILIDGAKVCGACPNRMDPPTSHVLTNNVESVEVIEGPYDVESFGTLSGMVKIKTKKPESGFHGEVSANAGSFGYQKGAATLTGGTDSIRALVSVSKEESDQYEDGDGYTLAEQLENYTIANPGSGTTDTTKFVYQDKYKEMKAYSKQTAMAKIYADVTDNQELQLSYTKNESDDVLYPSSKMDALYDDSSILEAAYTLNDLGSFSKALSLSYFHSEVDHPMSTKYRQSAVMMGEMISALTTDVSGIKIKNSFDAGSTEVTVGVDASTRNWDGLYSNGLVGIGDVDTKNSALFAKSKTDMGGWDMEAGLRYDTTTITPNAGGVTDENDYSALGAYVMGIIKPSKESRYFVGIGKSSRVPDARELYFYGNNGNKLMGTPDLKQTTNTEVDAGWITESGQSRFKAKVFYSMLSDYIYYNASKEAAGQVFENIDATIYGMELSGNQPMVEGLEIAYGATYQRGQKSEALGGQSDKDLAEIPPMKLNLAVNYKNSADFKAKLEVIAADAWKNYDEDNGEQAIAGYAVANMKVQQTFMKSLELTVGVDNIFDHTYAVSNTYKDLTLMTDSVGIMLLNEPGRYVYTNLKYRF